MRMNASPEGTGREATERRTTRCVLWHAPSSQPPSELLDTLHRRQVDLTRCTSAPMAVAQVCAGARPRSVPIDPRPGEGPSRDPMVLLLVRPSNLPRAGEAVEVVRRYVPSCICWLYDENESPRMRAVTEADLRAWASQASGSAPVAGAGASAAAGPASGPTAGSPGGGASSATGQAASGAPPRSPRVTGAPRLRLAGAGDWPSTGGPSRSAPAAPVPGGPGASPAPAPGAGSATGQTSQPKAGPSSESDDAPMVEPIGEVVLSDDELALLLGEEPMSPGEGAGQRSPGSEKPSAPAEPGVRGGKSADVPRGGGETGKPGRRGRPRRGPEDRP